MADTLDGVDPELAMIARRIIAESGGKITITSAHRSTEQQQVLYDRYKAGKGPLAAKPGTSMHEHGQAIDFGGDMQLLAQLASKYGLKNSVPGEPWHWTLHGENGQHTERHSEYDLGDETSSNPQDVLGNRLHSILRILGGTDMSGSPDWDDAAVNETFTPAADYEKAGMSSGGPKGDLQKYAAEQLKAMGMGPEETNALITLWNKESGWDPEAQNPTSTAYGIAQFLNGTWKGVGMSKTSDPYKQIDAGLKYISGRYGSPSRALSFHLQNNWY